MERLSRVRVATAGEVVEIMWDAREELLERARPFPGGDELRRRFEAVGATSEVKLDHESKLLALDALERWLADVGADALPQGILHLRNALINELATP